MHSHDEIELTAEERMLLASLPREKRPSDLLEERVVRSLRKDGHLGVQSRRGLPIAWRVAAALALFAGGVATGRYLMMPDAPRSASVGAQAAPAAAATLRPNDTTPPNGGSINEKNETVVAVRELWL